MLRLIVRFIFWCTFWIAVGVACLIIGPGLGAVFAGFLGLAFVGIMQSTQKD